MADSIIGQKDRKVNYVTVLYHHRPGDPCGNAFLYPLMGKLAFSAPIKCPLYSPVAFGKRFFLYKSTGPYSYIGRLFFSVYIAFQTAFPVWFLPGSSSDPEIYGRPAVHPRGCEIDFISRERATRVYLLWLILGTESHPPWKQPVSHARVGHGSFGSRRKVTPGGAGLCGFF